VNVKPPATRLDSDTDHERWIADIDETQSTRVNFLAGRRRAPGTLRHRHLRVREPSASARGRPSSASRDFNEAAAFERACRLAPGVAGSADVGHR